MDSVPLQLTPPPFQSVSVANTVFALCSTENPCSGCFCNAKAPEWSEALPWKYCMITHRTQTVVVTPDRTELFFGMGEGRELNRSKMWNSSGCLSVCSTLWKHRDVSLMELLHVCGAAICAAESIIVTGTGLSWDSAGTSHHLWATGQAISAGTVCFSLLKYKL